jgi:hypothetical protein
MFTAQALGNVNDASDIDSPLSDDIAEFYFAVSDVDSKIKSEEHDQFDAVRKIS